VQRLKVAVVGLGYWGPNLVRVFADRIDTEVRWICDADRGRLDRRAARFPGVRATDAIDEILADDEVDAVVLATPVFTHYELARKCLAAGKHTLVEKPLAHSVELAAELIDLATGNDVVLMCGHTFLYSPAVVAIHDLIQRRELGELYFISASRVNLGLHQTDVSVLWDLGPHDFSILLYWLGVGPTSIRAVGRDSILPGVADVAFVTMEFTAGLIVNLELSWLAPSKLRRTVIVGSSKMVLYEDGAAEPVKIYDQGVDLKDPATFGEYHLSYRTGDVVSPRLANDEPLVCQTDGFVRAIAERRAPEGHLDLARDVVLLAEAASHSLEAGGAEVALAPIEPA
jgi:predicted dehydrogenase